MAVTEKWLKRIIMAAIESFPINSRKKEELLKKVTEESCREEKNG